MKKKTIKKEIVSIDNDRTCGDLAYGYSNKQEAMEAFFRLENELPDDEDVYTVYVFKTEKDGEDWYYFGDTCPTCNCKIKGIKSFFWGEL